MDMASPDAPVSIPVDAAPVDTAAPVDAAAPDAPPADAAIPDAPPAATRSRRRGAACWTRGWPPVTTRAGSARWA